MARPRLKIGDITVNEILILSKAVYGKADGKSKIDNKLMRSGIDIVSGKIVGRYNLDYNRSEKRWEQTGREVKFVFMVRSNPVSYKKQDSLKTHKYPVTFIFRKFEKGLDSPFRWRTGSNYKPHFPTKKVSKGKSEKEKQRIRDKNKRIMESNIKKGIQMEFFFDLMWVLDAYGLLYGVNYTAWKPKVTNPNLTPYFDKHAYYCVVRILKPLIAKKFGYVYNKLFKQDF